jgi:hypothetical protein
VSLLQNLLLELLFTDDGLARFDGLLSFIPELLSYFEVSFSKLNECFSRHAVLLDELDEFLLELIDAALLEMRILDVDARRVLVATGHIQ